MGSPYGGRVLKAPIALRARDRQTVASPDRCGSCGYQLRPLGDGWRATLRNAAQSESYCPNGGRCRAQDRYLWESVRRRAQLGRAGLLLHLLLYEPGVAPDAVLAATREQLDEAVSRRLLRSSPEADAPPLQLEPADELWTDYDRNRRSFAQRAQGNVNLLLSAYRCPFSPRLVQVPTHDRRAEGLSLDDLFAGAEPLSGSPEPVAGLAQQWWLERGPIVLQGAHAVRQLSA